MPRQARLDIPGLLQHVIVRGIERRKIFLDAVWRGERIIKDNDNLIGGIIAVT
jgi:hypothetical protein